MGVKATADELLGRLIAQMRKNCATEENIGLIQNAYEFAALAHEDQKRKSGESYIVHPLSSALRLAEMHMDGETIAGALLHDVCEDTAVTIEDIRKQFGDTIAFLVSGVTKLDTVRYRGTERNAENLRKMFLAVAEDIRVVLIKLADRLHNMETLEHVLPEKRRRIALETLEVYAPIAYRLGIGELKGQLEDLAFPFIYPQEHQWLLTAAADTFEERNAYLARLMPEVRQEIAREGIRPNDMHTRAKHRYSLYKKLLLHDMDVNKIYDLVAIRIIVPSLEDCYRTLGVIHKNWRPMPGRIKDYIATPKPNGYRSLHTTVFGPEGKIIEMQIRTQEMHDEAENGITAHWAYTETKSSGSPRAGQAALIAKQSAWIRELREWQKGFLNPDEFLESLKIDFFKDRIFCFTPKGDVVDLPDQATPIDFAYQIHSAIGEAAAGAKINGKMVPLNHRLSSGDVVEILTQKNKKPSRDWLSFVRTASAKKKIAGTIRKEHETFAFSQKPSTAVELRLTAKDRIGLLKDVSELIARERISMKHIVSETKNRLYPAIAIHINARSKPALEKLIVKLKKIKGVEEVGYKLI